MHTWIFFPCSAGMLVSFSLSSSRCITCYYAISRGIIELKTRRAFVNLGNSRAFGACTSIHVMRETYFDQWMSELKQMMGCHHSQSLLLSSDLIIPSPSFSLSAAEAFSTARRIRKCIHSRTDPQLRDL